MEIIGAQNIKKIEEIVNATVQSQTDAIIAQAQSECEKIRASSDSEQLIDAIDNISSDKKRIEEQYKSYIAKAQRDNMKDYLNARNCFIDEIFDDVKFKISQYTQSQDYLDCLKKRLYGAKEGYVVLLSKNDMQFADALGAKCVETDEIIHGGLMLYYQEERTIIDKSFDNELKVLREEFLEKYGNILAGGSK